ncbi:MAG: DNA mismatch endonuclease Vsr [Gammaproteobacteria bacterium]|nr:DNA mismatch endonuclease Vsr [Terriglobia bacterium]MYF30253.1 DNA mismatch endonuclease Vsr [Gammaproteobacteria bacterium]
MTDILTASERSRLMSRIRSKDTKPEMRVRRLVHGMGYRYRLHVKDLPGSPDIVLRPRRKAIFVHGCFWHQHEGCTDNKIPKSRQAYWEPKLNGNVQRDKRNRAVLSDMGWRILVIWECETTDTDGLAERLRSFLDEGDRQADVP